VAMGQKLSEFEEQENQLFLHLLVKSKLCCFYKVLKTLTISGSLAWSGDM
jgi:hypothetical protein